MKRLREIILLLASFAFVSAIYGQSVYWVPSSGTLQRGKTNRIALHFEGCQPTSNFALPQIDNLTLYGAGNQQQTSIVNGSYMTKTIINYGATPSNVSTVQIPEFQVETDKGKLTIPPASFTVIEATIGNTGLKPEEVFYSEVRPNDDKIYMGEIFPIQYVFGMQSGTQVSNLSPPQWDPSNLVINEFGEYERANFTVGPDSKQYSGAIYESEGLATRSGTLTLEPANQSLSVVVGRQRGFFSFNENITEDLSISTKPRQIEILPLPDEAPTSFTGAVGNFQLESKIVPEEVQVGEPVTWTLTLSGKGNWPQGIGIPARPKPADFRNIQPDLKTEHPEDDLFQATQIEDIVLIPTQSGDYQIGPVEFSFFDPESESYKTTVIPAKTVRINSIASTSQIQNAPLAQADDTQDASPPASQEPEGINLIDKPIDLPRDAVLEGFLATAASGKISLVTLLWIPIVPSCAWLLIALARSFVLDPNKQRRLAHQELKKISTTPLQNEEPEIKALHRRWRQAAKTFWQIRTEEPTADEIAQAVSKSSTPNLAESWKKLWADSDRVLFGPSANASDAWLNEFRDAFNRVPQPSLSLANFFSGSAWAPLLTLVFLISFGSTKLQGNEALAYYNEGEFDKASELWLERLQEEPNNWAHRHNLGLCFAQKEDWGKALAFWTSAYALNPRQDDINWNARLALSKTGAYYGPFKDLLEQKGFNRIANTLSPAEWENLYHSCFLITILLLTFWVTSRYNRKAKSLGNTALILGCLSLLTALTSWYSHRQYEYLASPDAVIVVSQTELKSVPADLPTPQADVPTEGEKDAEPLSTPIAEGSIALLKKEFLGWFQLELPSGESGWIRKQHTVPLYGPVDRI